MKSLETEIVIDAPVEEVWNTLMDFESYAEWNPFIKSIKGKAKVGAVLENTLSLKEGSTQIFKPKILVLTPQQEFRWLGSMFFKGLFDGEHYFLLSSINSSQTKLTHGEKFSGLFAGLIMRAIRADTQKGFDQMNKALSKRLEITSPN